MSNKFLLYTILLVWAAAVDSKDLPRPVDLNLEVKTLNDGRVINLAREYKGKVILIVNTASKCAFTGQYEGLEAIYAKHKNDGLVVLGFPSNDFGNQEPGTEQQIQDFCRMTYGVRFPMFEKYRVTSKNPGPLYKNLGEAAGEYPRWNFHKYLIDRNGMLVASFGSFVSPESKKLLNKITELL